MKKSELNTHKDASLAHQLIKAGRLINAKGLAMAREIFNLPELKQSHLDLFPYIDYSGTSVSEIAKRKGVSKQSVSKLVQEMVSMKLLFMRTAPEDGRSKRVCFKTSGPFALQNGFEALMSIDHLIQEQLGDKSYKSTLKSVSEVLQLLESRT